MLCTMGLDEVEPIVPGNVIKQNLAKIDAELLRCRERVLELQMKQSHPTDGT
jgi:hypothetical protein